MYLTPQKSRSIMFPDKVSVFLTHCLDFCVMFFLKKMLPANFSHQMWLKCFSLQLINGNKDSRHVSTSSCCWKMSPKYHGNEHFHPAIVMSFEAWVCAVPCSCIHIYHLNQTPSKTSPLSISLSNGHTDRSSQNTPGHQQHWQQECHHGGGWKQTSPWRWDHWRAGPHRVLDERKQGEEEQRGSSLFTCRHAQTRHILSTFVRQSQYPAVIHWSSQRESETWRVGRLWITCHCSSSAIIVLDRSIWQSPSHHPLILYYVVGGVWGRGKGPRGDEEDPEQLRNWGGDERGWGPLLHHGD